MSDHSPLPSAKSEADSRAAARVFISVTSGDLRSAREVVRRELRKKGCAVIEQTEFPRDCRETEKMLEDQICGCAAVIHLVGIRYGGESDPSTLMAGAKRRSCAQTHADIAGELGVRLCVFLCADEFPFDSGYSEPEDKARLQRLYREEISAKHPGVVRVSNPRDVARCVRDLRINPARKSPARPVGRGRWSLTIACGAVLAIACLAAAVWHNAWAPFAVVPRAMAAIRRVSDALRHTTIVMSQAPAAIPPPIKEAPAFDPVRIRVNLMKHIRERAAQQIGKHALKQAGDWEKIVQLGNARDQQMTAVDLLIEKIDIIFEKKEADADYAMATRILGEKGLAEALEFLGAGDGARDAKIETLKDAGDSQEEALREALNEKLLKAALLEKDMQFEKAEAEYRAAAAGGGAWAEPRNQLAWFLIQAATTADRLDGSRMLDDAVEVCRGTLVNTTREQSPQDWAITERNLGHALAQQNIQMGGKLGERLLADAITAFRAAVEVRPPGQLPQYWARAQDGLGAALWQKGQGADEEERRRLFQEVLKGYDASLEICTREQSPRDWARTRVSLALALADLGAHCSGEEARRLLAAAAVSFRAALEVQKPEQLPLSWERSENGLAGVLLEQGILTGGEESRRLLAEAVAAFREAVGVCAREQLLQDRARSQSGLGDALKEQGKRAGREQGRWFLAEAASSYRAALEVYTPERLPLEWAATQNLLGDTLTLQGKSTSGEDSRRLLERAVAAYRAALEVKTQERFPLEWSGMQNNLGNALVELGMRGGGEEGRQMLTEAIRGFRVALEILPPAYTTDRATLQKGLSAALKELSKLVDGPEAEQLQAEAKLIDAELGPD